MQSDTSSCFEYPFSSGDLLLAAGVFAGAYRILTGLQRRRKIALRQSEVTEEPMVYLARTTDASEIQSARTPQRLLTDLTAAMKQPSVPPPLPMLGNDPHTARYPLHNAETPPER